MKTLTLATLTALGLLSVNAVASPAVAYTCVGHNKLGGEAVVFELLFADHGGGDVGYTNQSITILKRGWEQLEKPITLQMYGATQQNNCQLNEQGEFYIHGGFEMDPAQGDRPAYEVSFKSACTREQQFDVSGFCYFRD